MKHMKQRTKRNILLCVSAAAVVALAALITNGVTGFMSSRTDTSAGVGYITAEEAGSVAEIEAKINRLEQGAAEDDSEDTRSIKEKFTGSVVIGDSIAQGFAEFDVLNASSVTARTGAGLTQLDGQIEAAREINPATVFLSLGINDVIATNGDVDAFISDYTSVLNQIREELPGVNIFVNSILPAQQKAVSEESVYGQISEYNEALRVLCRSRDIGFIDNTELVQEEYYEQDGIHFRSEFYPLWAEHMAEVAAV